MITIPEKPVPADRILYGSQRLAVGRFDCPADWPEFPRSCLLNDLLVFVDQPLWWNRGHGDWAFLEPGSVVLHRRGREIHRRAVSAAGDRAQFYAISPELFEEVLETAGVDPDRVTISTDLILPPMSVRAQQRALLRDLADGACDGLEIEERSLALLSEVAGSIAGRGDEGARDPRTRSRHRRISERARAFVNEHLEEQLGLETVARDAGASVFHLCRAFRSTTGMTLGAYRLRQRVEAALGRMRDQRQDLAALAADLGFSSHSHMTRSFQRLLGAPPSSFNGAQRTQAAG